MSGYVLQTEDVAVHYGGVKAVDGVEITLQRGQIRGLIGPNGSGKSTVIDAITGRRRLTRGTVLLRGENVSAAGVVERRRRGLSRSFQRTSIFGQMPVRKQVELASSMMGIADPAPMPTRYCTSCRSTPAATRQPPTWATANSAGSTSLSRWSGGPPCCCWTSPWPACRCANRSISPGI